MPTSYPGALDTFPVIGPTDTEAAVSHRGQHNDKADAIQALQAKVGIDGSLEPTSLDFKTAALQADVAALDGDVTAVQADVAALDAAVAAINGAGTAWAIATGRIM